MRASCAHCARGGSFPTYRYRYLAKLRAFVKFLLANPPFDDSLVVFYPYTPRGDVVHVCHELAVCVFMQSKYTPKDTQVTYLTVSKNTRCTLYTVPCTLFPVPCTLFPVHCSLYTVTCTLFRQYPILCYIRAHLSSLFCHKI